MQQQLGKLDKAAFARKVEVVALCVEGRDVGKFRKKLSGYLFGTNKFSSKDFTPSLPPSKLIRKLKCVLNDEAKSSRKKILLSEEVVDNINLTGLPAHLVDWIKGQEPGVIEYQYHTVEVDYSYWSLEYILSSILPTGMDIPSSYEAAGHVAHLNLREPALPYKNLIGQVLLDKVPTIKSVVNKTSSIGTEFRTFPLEVIAGSTDLNVRVKESKAIFEFNYAEVYWNSRLQHEHQRMIDYCQPTDVICDMMCGIGPFAIPLAMKGCHVYANDLNPKSYQYLLSNVRKNDVQAFVTASNMDAREFIRKLVSKKKYFSQVFMNLPASALEFLDVFTDFKNNDDGGFPLPMIHCYCFSSADDPAADVLARAEEIVGRGAFEEVSVHNVRNVAPKKEMMCVSFRLPTGNNKRQRV